MQFSRKKKTLVLGTALWGWGIERKEAYALLDIFIDKGGRIVDTATNYPINQRREDFGLTLKWLEDWITANGHGHIDLLVKIGAQNNTGSPENNLTPDNLFNITNDLKNRFIESLACVSVHWDNRGGEGHEDEVAATVAALSKISASGLHIGLSGIKFPELYFRSNPNIAANWIIQIKENILTSSARESYMQFFPDANYLAYGINAGGIKTNSSRQGSSLNLRGIHVSDTVINKIRDFLVSGHDLYPRPLSANDLALYSSFINTALSGVIVGPRSAAQMQGTFEFWEKLEKSPIQSSQIDLLRLLEIAVRNQSREN